MPKSIPIHPSDVRKGGELTFKPIPINQYSGSIQGELAKRGKDTLLMVLRDMRIIRGFESMLNDVKLKGGYKGTDYNHRGPAHLSIGQEASAVGQALTLSVEDHIFGSHRSHGEILAKGLSAIEKLVDDSLMDIMKGTLEGQTLRVVDDGSHGDVKALAREFLAYGALAEIFAKQTGFNRGILPSLRRLSQQRHRGGIRRHIRRGSPL
jgi:2-oxoisovalerate dehydrogenase E1 component